MPTKVGLPNDRTVSDARNARVARFGTTVFCVTYGTCVTVYHLITLIISFLFGQHPPINLHGVLLVFLVISSHRAKKRLTVREYPASKKLPLSSSRSSIQTVVLAEIYPYIYIPT